MKPTEHQMAGRHSWRPAGKHSGADKEANISHMMLLVVERGWGGLLEVFLFVQNVILWSTNFIEAGALSLTVNSDSNL